MTREIRLTTKIGADTSELKNSLQKVGAEAKIKIPVDFTPATKNIGLNIRAQLIGSGEDFGRAAASQIRGTTVRADFGGFVVDQLANRIAKATGSAVEKAVRKGSKGDFLGAIGGLAKKAISLPFEAATGTAKAVFSTITNSATATARTAFQGIVFGATESASAELGQGINAGLQKAFGRTIGSPELIGRKIVENLIQSIGKAANTAQVDVASVGKVVRSAIGEQDVLVDSRAKSTEERQVKRSRKESAQVELNRERQVAAREQSQAIEDHAKVVESVRKQTEELLQKTGRATLDLRKKLSDLNSQPDADPQLKAEIEEQISQLLAPFTELENQEKRANARLNAAFRKTRETRFNFNSVEGSEEYRSQLIAFGKSIEAERNKTGDEIQKLQETFGRGLKSQKAIAAKVALDPKNEGLLQLQSEGEKTANAIALQIISLKKTYDQLSQDVSGVVAKIRAVSKTPNKIVTEILKELGVALDPENVPEIQLATDATLGKASRADYVPEANVVRVRQELFDEINAAQSAADLKTGSRTIREELSHAAQFDFGSAEGNRAFQERKPLVTVAEPTAEDIQRLASELQKYAKEGRSKDTQLELEAKVSADRLKEKADAIAKQAQDLTDLESRFGYAGSTVSKLLAKVSPSSREKITALSPLAESLGDDAISQVNALNQLIDGLEADVRQALNQVAQAKTGKSLDIDVAKQKEILDDRVRQLFGIDERIAATESQLKIAPPPRGKEAAGELAIANESTADLGSVARQVSGALSPIGAVAGGTVNALVAVGKAGLDLVDKLGFAASSLIPGGALAYGPAKEVAKFAAPGVAAGVLATQIPGAAEVISAISSTVAAIIAPATSGLSTTVGHAVSAEIAGALPSLFNQLTHLVADSGLPGSQVTAVAVEKLGGGLVQLLQPVISGVAHTADSSIVAVGQAVNEFLGQVSGLLLAGKGLQEGVKLATDPKARELALEGVETFGAGVGQVVHGVQDGIEVASDAIDRTTRAVKQNIEGVKAAAEQVGQGNIRAVGTAIEETQSAISNVTRGVQDVAKASTEAVRDVIEGTGKVAGVLRSVVLPDGLDLGDLAKEQLIQISKQLRQKLEKTIHAEAQGLPVIDGSATVRQDLELVGKALEAKYEVVIDSVGDEVKRQLEVAPLDLPIKIDLPDLEPVVVAPRQETNQKAKSGEIPQQRVRENEGEDFIPIELAQEQLKPQPPLVFPQRRRIDPETFKALIQEVRDEVDAVDNEIKEEYAAFAQSIKEAKKKKLEGREQRIAEAKRLGQQLAAKISSKQSEIDQSIAALSQIGVDTAPGSVIGDDLRRVNSALGQKAKLIPERIASLPSVPKDSLASLDISLDEVDVVLRVGASSLSNALKRLVDTVFEVQGDTLKQSLALAAQSPKGKDLAVNAAGLAASVAAGSQGPVAGIAADFAGALAARQALGGGGAETFGDITGFLTGNVTNAITGVAGSGAIAASVVVPQLQKLRAQIQAKYGQPIDVPIDVRIEGLADLDPNISRANQQVDQIDALLAELRKLEAEGKLVTPTLGERINYFFQSISKAFSKADSDEIALAIARIETELARAGTIVDAEIKKEIERIEKDSFILQEVTDDALVRLEKSLNAFDRVEEQINDRADRNIGPNSPSNPHVPNNPPDDLSQYLTQKVTVNPSDEERGVVARKRLERDASERQINDTLRRGKATGSLDENQANADLAIASFEKSASKFDSVAAQIEGGSTKAQQNLRKVRETFRTFKQKIEENGGVWGSIGKIGQSLSTVAEKAGIPVNVLGKLGSTIKGIGIAALAYIGITQVGDAIVELGRRAFDTYKKVELLQTRLKFVGGESNLAADLKFIREESDRLKIPVDQLTESFTALRVATKGTSVEGEKTKELATALGTLRRVYGLSAEQGQSIQYQLGQTIRLGRVQGDELRSLSDAGINLQLALEQASGKSGPEFQKALEAGQISAELATNALIKMGNEAKSGLPAALKTSQAQLDALQTKFTDVAITAGKAIAPLVVGAVTLISDGVAVLEGVVTRIAPVFEATASGAKLVGDIAAPIVGVIASIAGAVGADLLDGIAIPFRAIGAGLEEIRRGFNAIAGVAGQALGFISKQVAELAKSIPFLDDILKYANPATIAVRALGAAIGVFLVGQMIQMGVTVGSIVIPVLVSMAGTMTATLIPAILAARTAALAFIATPIGAVIAAIGIAAVIAAPHLDTLANSMSGVGDAAYKANERAIAFNTQYENSLAKLSKGIPLTVDELAQLKEGFAKNVAEGKDTVGVAATLTANLDRMQASAEAAAKIQSKLAEAMTASTKAIKLQSQAIDAEYTTQLAGLNDALANQQITRKRFDEQELDAQNKKTGDYLTLYKTQGDNLRNSLAEANARLASPIPEADRTEVKKQVEQLQEQIDELDQKGSDQRISLAQNRIKKIENLEKERADRAANELKALENQLAAGVGSELEIEQKISANKRAETDRRIKEIDRQLSTEVSATGELSDIAKNLYSERAVLETELTRISADESSKRYEILLSDLEKSRDKLAGTITEAEVQSQVELQQAQNAGLLKQSEIESRKTQLTRDRLQKDLALELANIETLQSLPSPTDPKKAEEHQKRIREGRLKTGQIALQLSENEYKRQEEVRAAALKAIDEQVKSYENAAQKAEQLGKVASNALERQNKILEAQKSLRASIVSLHDEEFKILIETETNERDKADLQQKAAKFRLDSLRQSQALEERILELQTKQEQVQSRVAILRAQANLVKAEAEQAKVEANPESTEADRQAAGLGVNAAQLELGASVETARLQEELSVFKRQQNNVDNRKELLGARFDYAKSIVDPSDREDAIERIQAEAARGLRERYQPVPTVRRAVPSDYRQLDSAYQQLGLTPRGDRARFTLPTPVNLHSGLSSQGLTVNLSGELEQLRLLTQNGVAANLVKLVSATEQTNILMGTLASRQPVTVQKNNTVVNSVSGRNNQGLSR